MAPADRIVGGRYELVSELGDGRGNVHRAIDRESGVTVALKLLLLPNDAPTESRFRREAQAAQAIDHPGCVRMLDFGTDEEARVLYIAMELVNGESLDLHLERSGGRLEPERAVEIILEVLSVLEVAHQAGVIHRDLKPTNILLAGDTVKVCDFGSAKLRDRHITQLTRPGMVIGTGQYMAPEQARGLECDERSDLYAAGAILFELLSGKPPYQSTDRTDDPRFDPVFAKSLADDKRDRFQSAAEMSAALKRALSTTMVEELPSKSKKLAPIAAVFMSVAIVGVLAFALGSSPPEESAVRRDMCAEVLQGEADLIADRPLDVYVGGEWLGRTPLKARTFPAGVVELEVVDPSTEQRKNVRVRVDANTKHRFDLQRLPPSTM